MYVVGKTQRHLSEKYKTFSVRLHLLDIYVIIKEVIQPVNSINIFRRFRSLSPCISKPQNENLNYTNRNCPVGSEINLNRVGLNFGVKNRSYSTPAVKDVKKIKIAVLRGENVEERNFRKRARCQERSAFEYFQRKKKEKEPGNVYKIREYTRKPKRHKFPFKTPVNHQLQPKKLTPYCESGFVYEQNVATERAFVSVLKLQNNLQQAKSSSSNNVEEKATCANKKSKSENRKIREIDFKKKLKLNDVVKEKDTTTELSDFSKETQTKNFKLNKRRERIEIKDDLENKKKILNYKEHEGKKSISNLTRTNKMPEKEEKCNDVLAAQKHDSIGTSRNSLGEDTGDQIQKKTEDDITQINFIEIKRPGEIEMEECAEKESRLSEMESYPENKSKKNKIIEELVQSIEEPFISSNILKNSTGSNLKTSRKYSTGTLNPNNIIFDENKRDLEEWNDLIRKYKKLEPSYKSRRKFFVSGSPEEKEAVNKAIRFANEIKEKLLEKKSRASILNNFRLESQNGRREETNSTRKNYSSKGGRSEDVFQIKRRPFKTKAGPKINLLQTNALPEAIEQARISMSSSEKLRAPWPSYSESLGPGQEDILSESFSNISLHLTSKGNDQMRLYSTGTTTLSPGLNGSDGKFNKVKFSRESKVRHWLVPEKQTDGRLSLRKFKGLKLRSRGNFKSHERDEGNQEGLSKFNFYKSYPFKSARRILPTCDLDLRKFSNSRQNSTTKQYHSFPLKVEDKSSLTGVRTIRRDGIAKEKCFHLTNTKVNSNGKDKKMFARTCSDGFETARRYSKKSGKDKEQEKWEVVECPCIPHDQPSTAPPIIRLPKVKIPEPPKICPPSCEVAAERADDKLTVKPKKLPCLTPRTCPCPPQPELQDVSLCRPKKRYEPEDPARVCEKPCGFGVPRADEGLKVKPKKLPCIKAGDCPCVSKELTDVPPLVRLKPKPVVEPPKVCPPPCEVAAERADDRLVYKPKKLPCLVAKSCPCVVEPELVDVKLCRPKKLYKPEDPIRDCRVPCGFDAPRADANLKVRKKTLPCIKAGECPCVPQVMVDVPPLVRLRPKPVQEPPKICPPPCEVAAERADDKLVLRSKRLPCLTPKPCPCKPQPELVDVNLCRLKMRYKPEDPVRICPKPCGADVLRADDGLKVAPKKLPCIKAGDCPCVTQEVADAPPLVRLKPKPVIEPPKVCPPPCEVAAERADDKMVLKPKKLPCLVAKPCPCVVEPEPADVKLCRPKKLYKPEDPIRDCRVPCGFDAPRADANLKVRKKTLPCIKAGECPCVPQALVDVPPLVRLKPKPVQEPPKICPPPCEVAAERADDKLVLKNKKLPCLTPKLCPCKPQPEFVDVALSRPFKRYEPEDPLRDCPQPCGFGVPRADEGLKIVPKKLPAIKTGDCPCTVPTLVDSPPLRRLKAKPVQEPPKICPPQCEVAAERADDNLSVKSKKLPYLKPKECPCVVSAPLNDVKLCRLPKVAIPDPPPLPKSCFEEPCPDRADDIFNYQIKKKKLTTMILCEEHNHLAVKRPKKERWYRVPQKRSFGLFSKTTALKRGLERRFYHDKKFKSYLINRHPNVLYFNTNVRSYGTVSRDDSKCKKLKKKQKCSLPKICLPECPPALRPPDCEKQKLQKLRSRPDCVKQEAPYVSFSECNDSDLEPIVPSECPRNDRHLQPKFPLIPHFEVLKPPPPHQGHVDPMLEEECVLQKLGMERNDFTRGCHDFNLPKKRLRVRDFPEIAEDERRFMDGDSKVCGKSVCCYNEMKPGNAGQCPVKDVGLCAGTLPDAEDECCPKTKPVYCGRSGRSPCETQFFAPVKLKKRNPCEEELPQCKTEECCESFNKTDCEYEKEDATCFATKRAPPSSACSYPCPCPRPERSLWQRIADFFRAQPDCPSPEEIKRAYLRRKAEKAAAEAGLIACEPRRAKRARKCAKKEKPKCESRPTRPEQEPRVQEKTTDCESLLESSCRSCEEMCSEYIRCVLENCKPPECGWTQQKIKEMYCGCKLKCSDPPEQTKLECKTPGYSDFRMDSPECRPKKDEVPKERVCKVSQCCKQFKMPCCPPRARCSCKERKKPPPCTKQKSPYNSFSDIHAQFKDKRWTECNMAEKLERERPIIYDHEREEFNRKSRKPIKSKCGAACYSTHCLDSSVIFPCCFFEKCAGPSAYKKALGPFDYDVFGIYRHEEDQKNKGGKCTFDKLDAAGKGCAINGEMASSLPHKSLDSLLMNEGNERNQKKSIFENKRCFKDKIKCLSPLKKYHGIYGDMNVRYYSSSVNEKQILSEEKSNLDKKTLLSRENSDFVSAQKDCLSLSVGDEFVKNLELGRDLIVKSDYSNNLAGERNCKTTKPSSALHSDGLENVNGKSSNTKDRRLSEIAKQQQQEDGRLKSPQKKKRVTWIFENKSNQQVSTKANPSEISSGNLRGGENKKLLCGEAKHREEVNGKRFVHRKAKANGNVPETKDSSGNLQGGENKKLLSGEAKHRAEVNGKRFVHRKASADGNVPKTKDNSCKFRHYSDCKSNSKQKSKRPPHVTICPSEGAKDCDTKPILNFVEENKSADLENPTETREENFGSVEIRTADDSKEEVCVRRTGISAGDERTRKTANVKQCEEKSKIQTCKEKEEARPTRADKENKMLVIEERLSTIECKLSEALELLNEKIETCKKRRKTKKILPEDQWKELMLLKRAERAAAAAGYKLSKDDRNKYSGERNKCSGDKNKCTSEKTSAKNKRRYATCSFAIPKRNYSRNPKGNSARKKSKDGDALEESLEAKTQELAVRILFAVKKGMKLLERAGFMTSKNPYFGIFKELESITGEGDITLTGNGGNLRRKNAFREDSKTIYIRRPYSSSYNLVAEADKIVARDAERSFTDNDYTIFNYEESEKRKTEKMVMMLNNILDKFTKA